MVLKQVVGAFEAQDVGVVNFLVLASVRTTKRFSLGNDLSWLFRATLRAAFFKGGASMSTNSLSKSMAGSLDELVKQPRKRERTTDAADGGQLWVHWEQKTEGHHDGLVRQIEAEREGAEPDKDAP